MEVTPTLARQTRATGALTSGIVLLIAMFGLTNSFQSVVMNRVVDAYHLSGGTQGIMSSMINIGSILAFLAAPLLQGRIKKTTMLLAACVLMAVSFFLLGTNSLFASMMLASVLTGIGFGWIDTNCNAVMVDLHEKDSSSYLGLLHGGFGVGGLIAPILITALLTVISWQRVSLIMGAIVIAAGLIFLLLLSFSARRSPSAAPEKPLTRAAIREFLFHRKNVLMLIAGMLYAITQSGLLIWLVRYMTLRYNAESLGAAALSIFWVCATLSRFFAPRLPIRPLKLFLYGTLLSCVFQTIGVLSGSPVVMCVMVGIIGLVTGHCVPMLISEITAAQTGNTALATSATLVTMCFMRIIFPVLMGMLADWTSVSVMMLTPAVSGALAALFAFLILRYERKSATLAPAQ
ncbi:MAG: MFS transporter [Christensenella sp.]|nr:MFS transporter [Christensenella sp.]